MRHGRRDYGVRIHSALVELLPEAEAFLVVADDDRDDRSLRPPDVEAEVAVALHHEMGVFPEALDVLGLVLHDIEGSHRGHDVGCGQGGREDEGAGVVLDVIDDVLVACDEAPEGCEALRERAHGDIDFLNQVEMGGRSSASAEDSDRVGVVHVNAGAVRLADGDELGQIDDVAAHGEYAVDDDEDAFVLGNLREDAVQLIEVSVHEALHLAVAELAAVDDAGMVFLVHDYDVVSPDQRGNRAEIGLHPRAEYERGFLTHERGEPFLELYVYAHRPVDEAAPGAAGSEDVDRLLSRFPDLGMKGQAKVVVRPQHKHFMAIHHDFGAFRALQGLEEGVQARLYSLFCAIELEAFLENIHYGLLFPPGKVPAGDLGRLVWTAGELISPRAFDQHHGRPLGSQLDAFII